MKQILFYILSIVCIPITFSQNKEILFFEEYLNLVKQYHPIAKQAELKKKQGQAEILKSRGNFDPKLLSNFQRKDFKGQDYFKTLDAKLKIPTWFGVEFTAGIEKNSGVFLNPEHNVPKEGLYNAGASLDVFGIWINKRTATLKKAKILANQRNIEYQLLINEIIFEASNAYFIWKNAYDNKQFYTNFVKAAKIRLEGVKNGVIVGDKAPIDSVEAKISFQNRQISLKQSEIDYQKARLNMETFLWNEKEIPLEIQNQIIPEKKLENTTDTIFSLPKTIEELQTFISNHPKLALFEQKSKSLEIERDLKIRQLLPKLDINYNFISPSPEQLNTFNSDEFKAGFSFSQPLFVRKERASLKLNKIKQQSLEFETKTQQLQISNKLKALVINTSLYKEQFQLLKDAVKNYETLLNAEERKFKVGESSLFLINSREQKLIDAQIKSNSVLLKLNFIRAELYNSLGVI